ncbi:hypothetical protein PN480_02450 [Dolichospermum circinale CS-1225]|uniref:4-Cys prefix domain-containing protein n=1 Tax=Dolichospermum circinale TaxID=109265 RepID=UPI002F2B755C|nr:hypothetical protein [Dolichospermum circinale CS-545/17]MDB9520812.1 hypothetical protein [Dolichospermum circinale CS-1225]
MSQCLNPTCLYQNPQGTSFCENCGSKILLDDRYRPIKFLGEGGFGRTFQAVDEKRLNTPCVKNGMAMAKVCFFKSGVNNCIRNHVTGYSC